MSGLRDFAVLDLYYKEPSWKPYTPPTPKGPPVFRMSTARDITLAEYDPSSQGTITAHRIKDYRRRTYSLTLLPNIRTVLDDRFAPLEVIEGAILTATSTHQEG